LALIPQSQGQKQEEQQPATAAEEQKKFFVLRKKSSKNQCLLYAFARKIDLLDFIVFIVVECLIIVLVIWIYNKIKIG
jgi:hypothetical protein